MQVRFHPLVSSIILCFVHLVPTRVIHTYMGRARAMPLTCFYYLKVHNVIDKVNSLENVRIGLHHSFLVACCAVQQWHDFLTTIFLIQSTPITWHHVVYWPWTSSVFIMAYPFIGRGSENT
ncbi:hypothetical protein BJ138DRAFT_323771 [Hygrophoropsis aurantiaca]|uniref:Uncharacterized protein n=1 Tax=Hygrophoropsis aurantiaca TaxID=72124 RepID=A0ACB8A6Q8_9AGAM|nr:hypothetical protein BJ138DRAFT_323771 [Hygrophoropsis aurantiaca]